VAGNVATNAGGISTLKHGVTRQHTLGVELVLPDGETMVTRSPALRDTPGPDVTGLLCGSEGTLGIVARVWARLTPRPRAVRTLLTVYGSIEDACGVVSDVIGDGIVPASMEVMDGAMIQVVEDAFHFGFPRDAGALLLIELDGVEAALDAELARLENWARRHNPSLVEACADPKRRDELWAARKNAFGAIGRISPSYCTQDACVPRSKLPEVIAHIHGLGDRFGQRITNVFHAGDGNVHPIMLFDENDPEQVQNTLRLSEAILEYCVSIGGVITGEHGVGVEKLHLMSTMFNAETLDVFDRVKLAFDPDRRLNDGKLIPSPRREIELLRHPAPGSPGGALVHG
jgi:glycolate oxidase